MTAGLARRATHMALILASWAISSVGLGVVLAAVWLAWLADRLWPGAMRGNCFTYATTEWVKSGGYVAFSWTPGYSIMGHLFLPRITRIVSMGSDAVLHRASPVNRVDPRDSKIKLLWSVPFFKYRVKQSTGAHSGWMDLYGNDDKGK